MVSVGLFDKDSRVHYVDVDYVVIDDPIEDFIPTLIKRNEGFADEKEVMEILNRLNMLKFGEPFYRSDGLWCQKLKPNGANYETQRNGDNNGGSK